MNRDGLRIFTGTAHPKLAMQICAHLGIPLGDAHVGRFPDGEVDLKVNCDVRGGDIFVVQPTCPPVNENLMELCIFIDCMRRASADRITAVIPYFGYARKDRKDEGRVPITAKLVANLITQAGADRVLAIDLHAPQIQGFFDIPVDHMYARPVFIPALRKLGLQDLVIVSPDVGGVKLCRAYSKELNAGLAIVDKRRIAGDQTVVEHVVGDVKGRNVLLVDDMISTGGSISDAVRIVKDRGAAAVYLVATHAVLAGAAVEKLNEAPVERIFIADTIPVEKRMPNRTEVVSVSRLLARAIDRIHRSESVSTLFGDQLES
jgi:ribose-phosphate pyrophosphokinase